jgi:hypothetical protein
VTFLSLLTRFPFTNKPMNFPNAPSKSIPRSRDPIKVSAARCEKKFYPFPFISCCFSFLFLCAPPFFGPPPINKNNQHQQPSEPATSRQKENKEMSLLT